MSVQKIEAIPAIEIKDFDLVEKPTSIVVDPTDQKVGNKDLARMRRNEIANEKPIGAVHPSSLYKLFERQKNPSPELIEGLARMNADPNYSVQGVSVLDKALMMGASPETIKILLGVGAKPDYQSFEITLHQRDADPKILKELIAYAPEGDNILIIAINGEADISVIKALVGAGVDLENPNALEAAFSQWPINEELISYLLDNGAKATFKDENGNSAFAIALQNGASKELLQKLTEAGADVNNKGGSIGSPAEFVIRNGELNKLAFLDDLGVDLTAKASDGKDLLALSIELSNDFKAWSKDINLLAARNRISFEAAQAAIAKVYYQEENWQYFDRLQELGMDVNISNEKGENLLNYYTRSEQGLSMFLVPLLERGSNPNGAVETLIKNGHPAWEKLFETLWCAGADFETTSDGKSMLDLPIQIANQDESRHEEMLQMFSRIIDYIEMK